MKLRDFPFLADQNIHRDVVEWLRQGGCDVLTCAAAHLFGAPDEAVLARAAAEGRVVVTHDSDFGTLSVVGALRSVGILFLRPGHIKPEFTIGTLQTILARDLDVVPPFLVVAARSGETVNIRIRSLPDS